MATISDVLTPEQERDRLRHLLIALVLRAGGEITLGMDDVLKAKPGLALETFQSGSSTRVTLRVVDPNAPVEGATYWVKIDGKAISGSAWIAGTYTCRKWWIVGSTLSVTPEEVGERIQPPVGDADPPDEPTQVRGGAPAGYQKLAPGARCRCMRLWLDVGDGSHWCCNPTSTANKTAGSVDRHA